jgi:hypothetical protein
MGLVRVGQLLTVSGSDLTVDDGHRGRLEGVDVFYSQDKLRNSEFLRQMISNQDVIQAIHEVVHLNTFLLEGWQEKERLGLVIKGNTHGLKLKILLFQIGSKGPTWRCFLKIQRGWHLVIELTFCLLEQGMYKCICSHAAWTIQNVFFDKGCELFHLRGSAFQFDRDARQGIHSFQRW